MSAKCQKRTSSVAPDARGVRLGDCAVPPNVRRPNPRNSYGGIASLLTEWANRKLAWSLLHRLARQKIIDRLLADAHRAVEGRAHAEDTPQ